MKLRQLWLPVSLGIAMVISLGLSVMLWTNPAHSTLSSRTKVTKTNDNSNNTTFQDIYLPSQIVSTDSKGQQEVLTNDKINIASQLRDKMSRFTATDVQTVSERSSKAYLKQLKRKSTVLLNYETPMTVNFFRKVFDNQLKVPNQKFNRVQLLLNDPKHLYLLNDQTLRVARVKLKNNEAGKLKKVLSDQMVKHPVSFMMLNGKPLLYYPDALKLKTYSYQLTEQTQSYYANRIMTTNANSSVQIKHHKNSTVYDDHGFRHMVVSDKDDTVVFTNYNSQVKSNSFLTTMNHVYQQMVMVGMPLDNMRFFAYDSGAHTVSFRTYVGGLPVFDQSNFGAVQVQILDQTSYQMNFSLDSLQVPIPPAQDSATVESMGTLLKRLEAAGVHKRKIQDIQLGYTWTRDTGLDKVVNLTPTWYIKIGGKWQTYEEAIQ
ncbi:YycH family regulatory protein [Secundilactobacillus similis]|nr:two-component system activity regulator YycH [Secundilactobacillus similis]